MRCGSPSRLTVRSSSEPRLGAVEQLKAGRRTRVYTPGPALDRLAVGADGELYATTGCRVVRLEARNRLTTVAGRPACRYKTASGPRPATAGLCGTGALEAAPDGTLLLAEGCNGLVRIRPGATIEPVTGWPESLYVDAVAAMPDGSVVAPVGDGLYRSTPGGPLERLLDWAPTLLAPVDEGLLVQQRPDVGTGLLLLEPGGRLRPVLQNARSDGSWDGDGEPTAYIAGASDVARAPDGGWLVAAQRLRYIAPAKPGLLAVAIRRKTLPPTEPLRVALSLSRAAQVTVEILVAGRRRAIRHVRLGAGNGVVRIQGASRRELNVVRVVARDAGQRAEDRASLLTGDRLPMPVAAWLTYRTTTVPTYYDWLVEGRRGCRRVSARRIDCATVDAGSCDGIVAVRLRRDGRITVAYYESRDDDRCEFRQAAGRGTVTPVPDLPEG